YRYKDVDGTRAPCVRLLVEAGADVDAPDDQGNTPLHETFFREGEEGMLKMGAGGNAQNKNGEKPIFTTGDQEEGQLFIEHGADLSIRNKKGETVLEAAEVRHGPLRVAALERAIAAANSSGLTGTKTPPE